MFTTEAEERVGTAYQRRFTSGLRSCLALPRRLLRGLAAPLRDERGSAVMEFALVGPPFLLLLAGILEVSVMFFTSSVTGVARKESARRIRTGQIQESADPLATFQSELCDALFNVIDCTKVVFHVQTFSSFSAVSMPLEIDEDGNIVNTTFAPGGSSAVTVVRASYRWKFVTPLIEHVIPGGVAGHLIVSTVAFQNEPYDVD